MRTPQGEPRLKSRWKDGLKSLNHTFLRQATRPFIALLLGWLLRTLLLSLISPLNGLSGRGRALRLRLGTTMQSLDPRDSLVESLALGSGNLELELARLAGTVGTL